VKRNKTILLIYSQLNTGGVETLIVRMANWLVAHDRNVKIILENKSDLDHLLNNQIEIKYFGMKYLLLFEPFFNKLSVKSSFFNNIDVIFSFEARSCWLASLIHKNIKKKPIFITGVYQPYEYNPNSKKYLRQFYHKMMKEMVPSESVLFMNSSCKKNVEKNLGTKFVNSNYFPLPVNIKPLKNLNERRPYRFKIVSIGRIVDFKTYNFHMIDIVRKLIEEKIEIVYEIYGHGPQEKLLKKKITELELNSNVIFKGKLNYENIPEVLEDAYLFIGMGTSVIEAAMCGVPSIVAIMSNPNPTCYGIIHDLNTDNVGEVEVNNSEILLENVIKTAISWSNEKYKEECFKSIDYVKKYYIDNVMRNYLNILEANKRRNLKYLTTYIYEKYYLTYIIIQLLRKILKKIVNIVRDRHIDFTKK